MSENASELRSIAWTQAFPFVRLFRTLPLALGAKRLLLALAAVLCLYIVGRVLDAVWGKDGQVVYAESGTAGRRLATNPAMALRSVASEIDIYATGSHESFRTWRKAAIDAREQLALTALRMAEPGAKPESLRSQLESHALRDLVVDKAYRGELETLRRTVNERVKAGRAALNAAKASNEQLAELYRAADAVRYALSVPRPRPGAAAPDASAAIERLLAADPNLAPADRAQLQSRLTEACARLGLLYKCEWIAPRGPFASLLDFERHCLAAAVQGAASCRFGFQAHALDAAPAMAGSLETAVRGAVWLVNQRPLYALVYGVLALIVLAYFGGAICRSAAVQVTRDESVGLVAALGFVRERYTGFILAPLVPVGVLVGIAVLMFIGGLIGLIPWLGELVTGVLYPLALLGGLAAAVTLLALVLGFHLMWPTIAVEGSDGFDALSRACSYVFGRIWHVLFYTFVLLVYGAASLVLVRIVALLMLKLSHRFTGLGMNLASSGEMDALGKLNALWRMPAWADLSLLPSTVGTPFWGTFANGPLDGSEWLAAWLLRIWVYLVVGLVAAFVVSFFFCGSTQMYFLLRRLVDATDYDEIYYEEPAEEEPPATSGFQPLPAGEAEKPAGDTQKPAGGAEKPAAGGAAQPPAGDSGGAADERPG